MKSEFVVGDHSNNTYVTFKVEVKTKSHVNFFVVLNSDFKAFGRKDHV